MFKIKLLILLLINLFILSCTNDSKLKHYHQYKLSYIGGEYDGLILSELLNANLKSFNLYNQNSSLEIRANIKHDFNLYITNIDNTSDREKITTYLNIEIFNNTKDCKVFDYNSSVSQFYIFASSEKFISNKKATEEIKFHNTEILVQNFIDELIYEKIECKNAT